MSKNAPSTLAIDIGGTGIKGLVLDPAGEPLCERIRELTPKPATPVAVMDVINRLAEQCPEFHRVAIGFPGVVRRGIIMTAPNLDVSWKGFGLSDALEARLWRPVRVANDADVQGFGVISGQGMEMVLTLGTGMGSALFMDGILLPNLELAHHPFADGKTYEQLLGQKALEELGEGLWKKRLTEAIDLLRRIFNFDVLYLGGGNSRLLSPADVAKDVEIVSNKAGLLGGIALWTGVHGTSLWRAPQAEGACCLLPRAQQ